MPIAETLAIVGGVAGVVAAGANSVSAAKAGKDLWNPYQQMV